MSLTYLETEMRLFVFILFFVGFSAQAQDLHPKIRRAEKAISKSKFFKSTKILTEVVSQDTSNLYSHYRLGWSLFSINNFESAIDHYEKAKPVMKDTMRYHLEMYHLYSKAGYMSYAKEAFIKYLTLCPSCVKGDLLPGVMSNKLMYKHPIKQPVLMGYENKYAQSFPYIIGNNQVLHLNKYVDKTLPTRPRGQRLYMTTTFTETDGSFYNAETFNTRGKGEGRAFGPFTLSSGLDKTYATRWDDQSNRLLIFFTDQDTRGGIKRWNKFKQVRFDIDDKKCDFIHPMFTKDNKHLIFSSNVAGGLGGYDLWMGEISSDNLTIKNIKNLGTYVNTPRDEMFPTVYDNDVVFFASDGHYGYGGLDLYAGIKYKDKFRKTYNLGNRFNTPSDEYALFYNTKQNYGLFTSNQFLNSENEMNIDRIYKQSFDKVATHFFIEDQYGQAVPNANLVIASENVKLNTNAGGKVTANISPLGYKRLVLTGDRYEVLDTTILPFVSRVDLRMKKKEPSDLVSFSLVSHPYEHPAENAYFILTSQTDKSHYTGTVNSEGIGTVNVYGNDLYEIDVPAYGFKQKDISFNGLSMPKLFVSQDKVKSMNKSVATNRIDGFESKPSIDNAPLTDSYNLFYESGGWVLNDMINRQIQSTIKTLNQNPSFKLELKAHTDCQGDKAMNLQLSKARLAEAKKLFFSYGVSDAQIVGSYFGESLPANSCKCDDYSNSNCSGDELRLNRRTEVKILK